jgi:calcium-dependent protein kinase
MDMSIGASEPNSGATTSSSSPRRSNEDRGKPTPPAMQTSVESFDRAPYPNKPKNNDNNNWDPGMITSGITNVKERYHINPQEVGHGHYGVVRKCMDRETKEWYAIKSIRKSKVNKVEVLKREIEILKEVNHPNIIRLIEVHEDEKYLHLITELCTGGELFDRIIAKTQSPEGHFSERDAANLIRLILDAIAYCHDELQIVHRDLKPENFLFASHAENAPIKIIDFGLSRHESNPGLMMKTKVSFLVCISSIDIVNVFEISF